MEKEPKLVEIEVTESIDLPARIDRVLAHYWQTMPRNQIQKLIKGQKVLLNGKVCRSSEIVKEKDVISYLPSTCINAPKLKPAHLELEILFQDSDFIALNKKRGVNVHPGAGPQQTSLVEGLLYQGINLYKTYAEERPGVVHRLDKDTSGVVLFAKTEAAYTDLQRQFKERLVYKEYIALHDGVLPLQPVVVENLLLRHDKHRTKYQAISLADVEKVQGKKARYAKSCFELINIFCHQISFSKIQIFTGRTHQIRVHSEYLKCPILGDPLYGNKRTLSNQIPTKIQQKIGQLKYQMLHAYKLKFTHPISGHVVELEAELPYDMLEMLTLLKPYKTYSKNEGRL